MLVRKVVSYPTLFSNRHRPARRVGRPAPQDADCVDGARTRQRNLRRFPELLPLRPPDRGTDRRGPVRTVKLFSQPTVVHAAMRTLETTQPECELGSWASSLLAVAGPKLYSVFPCYSQSRATTASSPTPADCTGDRVRWLGSGKSWRGSRSTHHIVAVLHRHQHHRHRDA